MVKDGNDYDENYLNGIDHQERSPKDYFIEQDSEAATTMSTAG